MSNPLVSVIITVRNGERFLAAALESVRRQDYEPYELIVVDGQSKDRTAEMARAAGARHVMQTGSGVSDGYNLGVRSATGGYIAFLSHDDVWMPEKLGIQMAHMRRHPELLYTVTRFRWFLEPGCGIPPGFKKSLLQGDYVGRIMETLVARREAFERVGLFETRMKIASDVDWFSRAQDLKVPMAVLPQVLLHKRVHDTNLSIQPATGNPELLVAMRDSIRRKRQAAAGGTP